MASITRYAALNTKVRALESNLLAKEDYLQLIACQNEADAIHYLTTKTIYGEQVYSYASEEAESVLVERALRQYLFDKYEQMMHFVIDEDRKLFKTLLVRYEVESLKMIIRAVYSKLQDYRIADRLVVSKHFENVDFKVLSMSKTVEEVVNNLMHTSYGPALKPYLNESSDRILFYLEMNLDRMYFKQLADRIAALKGEGRKFMAMVLGTNIDFLNIQWIYRGLKYYHLAPEELFNYCLNNGFRLSLKKLKPLCYVAHSEELIKLLKETAYGYLLNVDKNIDIILETEMAREIYNVFSELIQRAHFNLTTPIGYLHKLEYEIKDIFSILEAKRYRLDSTQTKTFLVRTL